MTREEAKSCIGTIKMLQRLAYNIHGVMDVIEVDNCKKIIKALEQEPCEDCISKQAAIEAVKQAIYNHDSAIMRLTELPPVNPQPKTGHWIRVTDKSGHLVWECDKCGWQQRYNTNFCPDCGQPKMQEVEE